MEPLGTGRNSRRTGELIMLITAQQLDNSKLRRKVLNGKYVPKSVKKAIASRERMINDGMGYHYGTLSERLVEVFNKSR